MNLQNQIEYLGRVDGVDMFDGCSVPDPLDMELVRGAIVMRCGLLTPLYSEPLTMHAATMQFFHENQWNFAQIVKVIEAEYNPVENVFEDRTETETFLNQHDSSGTNAENTENKISAENVNTYSPDRSMTVTGNDSRSLTENDNRNLTVHRNGNIGVTSAQSLIHETLDLVDRFSPYRFIADLYEKELMLGIY